MVSKQLFIFHIMDWVQYKSDVANHGSKALNDENIALEVYRSPCEIKAGS